MISLTDTAEFRMRMFLKPKGPDAKGIRIKVVDSGCNGNSYAMSIVKNPAADDTELEVGPVKLFVDPESKPMLDGLIVDFVDGLGGGAFKFINPNAGESCACGKSFTTANGAESPEGAASCGPDMKANCSV